MSKKLHSIKNLTFLTIFCLFLANCSNEEQINDGHLITSENTVSMNEQNMFDKAGYLHNDGMDFIKLKLQNNGKAFSNKNFKSSNYVFSREDSILVLNKINDYVIEYMLQDNILSELQVDSIFVEKYCRFSQDELLSLSSNYSKSQEKNTKIYDQLLKKINSNYIDENTLTWIQNNENELKSKFNNNKDSQTQVDLIAYSVAKYSTEYFLEEMKDSRFNKAEIGAGVVAADISGAYNGGTAGLLAGGPVGAVAVGTAGALIGSSTAYMIDKIWDEIW